MPNKDLPHLLILPEDSAFKDIANGFLSDVDNSRVARIEPFRGGKDGLRARVKGLVPSLMRFPHRYLVILFDGDGKNGPLDLWAEIEADCPHSRVFFFWTRMESEDLRTEFRANGLLKHKNSFEEIGRLLAAGCRDLEWTLWNCQQLADCADMRNQGTAQLRHLLFS